MPSLRFRFHPPSLILHTFILLLSSGCHRSDTSTEQKPEKAETGTGAIRITPVHPVRKTMIRRTEQPGQIEAFEQTPLFAKVTGYVKKVHVDIGDEVEGP